MPDSEISPLHAVLSTSSAPYWLLLVLISPGPKLPVPPQLSYLLSTGWFTSFPLGPLRLESGWFLPLGTGQQLCQESQTPTPCLPMQSQTDQLHALNFNFSLLLPHLDEMQNTGWEIRFSEHLSNEPDAVVQKYWVLTGGNNMRKGRLNPISFLCRINHHKRQVLYTNCLQMACMTKRIHLLGYSCASSWLTVKQWTAL